MPDIPTVLDRLIQQALLQVLDPIFAPTFSEASYGFRPGRSAQQAVLCAHDHIAAGYRWVVDVDFEKFFDRLCSLGLVSFLEEHGRLQRVS